MRPDGSAQQKITKQSARAEGSTWTGISRPAWSYDNQSIIFNSARDGNYEIYRMNAGGTGQYNLTKSPGDDYDPAW